MLTLARLKSAPEIFYSLQGEGPRIGSPAVFLRLAGCNLRCRWCDTKYSWGEGIPISEAEAAERILAFGSPGLVITGGEPLLQQAALQNLLERLPRELSIEVETNGTLFPEEPLLHRIDQWNVSPKLDHAGNDSSLALQPDVLETFAALPNAWFKFVVESENDWAAIEQLHLPQQRIILMPCAANRETLTASAPAVAELCIRHRVRYGHRLHVSLWSDAKGV